MDAFSIQIALPWHGPPTQFLQIFTTIVKPVGGYFAKKKIGSDTGKSILKRIIYEQSNCYVVTLKKVKFLVPMW